MHWRGLKLVQRALAGDVDAMIEWLSRFGGAEWYVPAAFYSIDVAPLLK